MIELPIRPLAAVLFVSVCAYGCSSIQYDEQTDKLITALQTDSDSQMTSLISWEQERIDLGNSAPGQTNDQNELSSLNEKLAYSASEAAYDKISVDITTLKIRIDSAPNNNTGRMDQIIGNIDDGLLSVDPTKESLRWMHEQNKIGTSYLERLKSQMDSEFQTLLMYELVLKSWSTGNSK